MSAVIYLWSKPHHQLNTHHNQQHLFSEASCIIYCLVGIGLIWLDNELLVQKYGCKKSVTGFKAKNNFSRQPLCSACPISLCHILATRIKTNQSALHTVLGKVIRFEEFIHF